MFKVIDLMLSYLPICRRFMRHRFYREISIQIKVVFISRLLMENSLQIFTFSLVNIISQASKYEGPITPLEKFSFILSGICFITTLMMGLALSWISFQAFKSKRPEQVIRGSLFASLFDELRINNKQAILYYPLYMLRRLLVALATVTLIKSPTAQIFTLLALSLCNAAFIIKYQPFKDRAINNLELLNECFVMASTYYLLTFTDWVESQPLKFALGWGLNLMIIAQFLLNTFIYLFQVLRYVVILIWRECQASRQQTKRIKVVRHLKKRKVKKQKQKPSASRLSSNLTHGKSIADMSLNNDVPRQASIRPFKRNVQHSPVEDAYAAMRRNSSNETAQEKMVFQIPKQLFHKMSAVQRAQFQSQLQNRQAIQEHEKAVSMLHFAEQANKRNGDETFTVPKLINYDIEFN